MSENLWPELAPQTVAQIQAALAAGNKLEAIKLYREATNCGLKEAKDAVERVQPPPPARTLWPQVSPEAAAKIEAALARGNKIEAIKILREATNCGLKEAKDAIDRMQPLHTNEVVRRSNSNWLTIVLALLILGVILMIVLIWMR